MEKLKIQRTENGGKGRENGGKGRENGGKGRTLKIEVKTLPETCPKDSKRFHGRFCNSSNLYIFQSWNFVESSNPSHSMSMKANTWNVQLWKKYSIPHRIHVWYIYANILCILMVNVTTKKHTWILWVLWRVFLHCLSCSMSYIGKSLAACLAVCQGVGP